MAFQYNIVRIFEEEKAEVKAEGDLLRLISQLKKKYQKGKTAPEAADDLEEETVVVQPFYELIAQYPEESSEEILARYKEINETLT